MTNFVTWLDALGARIFMMAISTFIVVNGLAIAYLIARRDRALVNRWTPRLLVGSLVLLGIGFGAPVLAKAATLTISLVSPRIDDLRSVPDEHESRVLVPSAER